MNDIDDIKKRAGLLLTEGSDYFELHHYNPGNTRPFVMEGHRAQILSELQRQLDRGDFEKIEIIPTGKRS